MVKKWLVDNGVLWNTESGSRWTISTLPDLIEELVIDANDVDYLRNYKIWSDKRIAEIEAQLIGVTGANCLINTELENKDKRIAELEEVLFLRSVRD